MNQDIYQDDSTGTRKFNTATEDPNCSLRRWCAVTQLLNSYFSLIFHLSRQVISVILRCSVKNSLSFSKFCVCNLLLHTHVEETQPLHMCVHHTRQFSCVVHSPRPAFPHFYLCSVQCVSVGHLQIPGFVKKIVGENDSVFVSSSGVQ